MYAVIETGGKQYRVELGSEIRVDRLDAQPGDSITLDRVLLVADGDDTAVGQPVVDGASVRAEVLGQDRGDKVIVFKYKQKARTRVKAGFRAQLTRLRVADIAFAGRSAAEVARSSESQKARTAREAEKAAADKAAADRELAARLAEASEPADVETAANEPAETARAKPAAARKPAPRSGATKAGAGDATADDATATPQADPDTRKDE